MIEQPCTIQRNIDRYRAALGLRLPEEQRARDSSRQFANIALVDEI
jgi:hypothetical protein